MKKRLDLILYERGYAKSREKAKAMIMAGQVSVDGEFEYKPGHKLNEDVNIEIKGKDHTYVSRGGLKLEKAIKDFNLNLRQKVCMDIGASTGGFTDCMLINGAKKVYSIDVGYGQLDWKLRNDERVVCMERTNARYLTKGDINDPLDFISMDVSFISIKKIIPAIRPLMQENTEFVSLIKPQFEAGRYLVEKKGVVKNKKTHILVIEDIIDFVLESGFSIKGLTYSPITGPAGNIEFLIYFAQSSQDLTHQAIENSDIKTLVEEAHEELSK